MKFTILFTFAAGLVASSFAVATPAAASAATTTKMGVEQPSSSPIYLQPVVQGCFSSSGDLVYNTTMMFNSRGSCGQTTCQAMGALVGASTEGSKCYCGNSLPPKDTLVDDKYCNTPCTGFGQDACGGTGYWTVYNTGLQLSDVPYANDSSSSTSSSSAAKTSTTTSGGQTVFVTATSDADSSSKKSSTNTAGIAAGVTVGVVVVGAGVGAVFYFLRRRRNKEIEEEYRRNAAVNAFFAGKPPSSSGGFSGSDSRLDPVMAQRRMSDGSIADNEDYSRRILRVTNA